MLRSFFIYLSKATWARKIVTGWPFARKMASRFVSGDKLDDAITAIKVLNSNGINATLDHLGEHTSTAEESRQATRDIIVALDAIQASGVRANMSIKLTQLGLKIDRELCAENLREILAHAKMLGNFVRVDMEDAPVTQVTLDLVLQMRREGFENVGVVIQSYLYRSEEDICNLIRNEVPVRLCKGAYKEPAEVAYPKKSDVDINYDKLADLLMKGTVEQGSKPASGNGRFPPLASLATHDDKRVNHAKAYAQTINLPKNALEFQMLYGIRRDIQERLAKEGYPVRIYVPYGTEWYPYYMRRLAERPANVWFFVVNFFRH
jgi:proline dehydrogenase